MTSTFRWPISVCVAAPSPRRRPFYPFFGVGGGGAFIYPIPLFLKAFNFIFLHFTFCLFDSRLPNQHLNRLIKTTPGKYRQPITVLDSTDLHSLAVSTVKVSCTLFIQERPTDNRKTNNSSYIWKFKWSNIEQWNGGYNKKHLLPRQ